jgi:hypothetical protein
MWLCGMLAFRFSVRAHVIGLILVLITPLLAFNAFLVLRTVSIPDALIYAPGRHWSWILILAGA